MKKIFLVIFLFVPVCLWAQELLTLPVVSPEERTPVARPAVLPQGNLTLPVVSPEAMASVARPNFSPSPPLSLPQAESQVFEISTHQFGGLNLFVPTNKVPKEQMIKCLNLIPEGFSALKKRDGYEKINFTVIDGVYGAIIAQGTIPQIVVACADSLRYADPTTTWEFDAIDTTESVLTYFVSTPFGVIVTNGEDSTRIWDGSSISALGIVDTGTFDADSTVGGDTSWVADSSAAWTADEWIGYWLKCSGSYLEIIDNGNNWFHAKLCGDTCDAETTFQLLSRPDSVGSTLGYPIGKAGVYFQDRFFINSDYWKWRIYFSATRDPDDIPPENIINLDMDVHDEIVAMVLFNNNLLVFGKYSTYGINTSRVATPITKSLGCVSPYSIALGDDYVYFNSERGIYRFKSNIYGSFSYNFEKISTPVDDIIGNIDPQNVERCGGFYANNQYWFSYHPDSCLVFDERTQQWYGPQTLGFTSALVYGSVFGKTWGENLYPNASVDTSEWTVSTGADSHYYYIYHPDSLDDYLWTGTYSAEREFFEFDNTGRFPVGGIADYLSIYIIAERNNYTGAALYIDLVANEQRYVLDTIWLSTSWTTYEIKETTNPITSSSWTEGDLDSFTLGITQYFPSLWAGQKVYLGAVWAKLQYQGDLTPSSFLFSSPSEAYMYKYGGRVSDDTSATGDSVHGKHITATYQSGWLDNDLPVDDKLLRQFYLQTESDSGDVWVYYYVDYGTTPSDSDLVHLGSKRTSWWMLGEKVKGKNFSIEIENKSNVDSLTIKGWSAILNNLGHRGGE